jgi:hypothetical protein
MPRRSHFASLALRLVLVATACVVLATARLPEPVAPRAAALRETPARAASTAPERSPALVRVLLALTLAASLAAELHRRRAWR